MASELLAHVPMIKMTIVIQLSLPLDLQYIIKTLFSKVTYFLPHALRWLCYLFVIQLGFYSIWGFTPILEIFFLLIDFRGRKEGE